MLAFLVLAASLQASQTRKLLILGIDGCRPDALLKCGAPNLRALADSGLFTWWALSRPPTKSGPCWSSIFTGVWNDKHGVTDNNFTNQQYGLYPMLFTRLKDADPSFTSGWFVYWPALNDAMPHGADVAAGDWSDENTLQHSVELLVDGDPDALFVHLGEIDSAGHSVGFDPDKPAYLDAIEETDGRVGAVLAAMKSRPGYRDEHWRIIALSDHGGLGTHHGGSTIEEMRVFFIVAGDDVPRGEIPHEWTERTLAVPPYGLKLDGADDCVSIPDSPVFHFGTDGDFTIEICVQTSGWSGSPVLFSNKNSADETSPGIAFVLIDEAKWRVNVADGSKKKNISGPIIADGRWHHLAAVLHRKGTLTLYQDGIRTGAVDIAKLGSVDTEYGLTIGRDGTQTGSAFAPATVNEIRIWNTALPDSVVRNWTFTPITPSHSRYMDLAGYWKMDDGEGTRISDAGPYANHGRFIGTDPQWTRPQAYVETLDFDSCRTAKAVDLAVTALAHFGIDIHPDWNLDGVNLVPAQIPDAVRGKDDFPDSPALLENYPNPFNAGTEILFSIPESGRAGLKLFDGAGREVAVLLDGYARAGRHRLFLSGDRMTSGVYILRLEGRLLTMNKKILLIK
jgi:arylsulfatase A-like enzyme